MGGRGEAKNIFVLSGVYIATVIGAGFASGQEILSFFVVYGAKSIYGLLLVTCLFALYGSLVMYRVYKSRLDNFREYLTHISGRKTASVIEVCTVLFMLAGFCSMSAGSGAVLQSGFGWHYIAGVLIMIALCSVVFLFDLRGLLAVNAFLAPILCIGMVSLGVMSFLSRSVPVFAGAGEIKLIKNWFVSALVYSAYNLLTSVVVLADSRTLLRKGSTAIWSGVIGGGVLGGIAVVVWAAISLYYGKVDLGELPFLSIVARQGKTLEYIYSAVLYIAMFTTAVSCGYGFLSSITKMLKIKGKGTILLLAAITVPISLLGFSGIVQNLYSAFGYLGLPLVAIVLWDGLRLLAERKRKK